MRSDTALRLIGLLGAIEALRPSPEAQFLTSRGWIPLGRNSSTGLNEWGKVIDGKAVAIDEPGALEREGRPKL